MTLASQPLPPDREPTPPAGSVAFARQFHESRQGFATREIL